MSKHSLNYNLNQTKYSLKFIIYLFIILDILLFFNVSFALFGQIIGWELSIFIGLAIGLKAQGRYREAVYDMIALRKDPKYNDKEELRGHRLIRLIDRIMIDYDIYLENQNKKYLKSNKKNSGGRFTMKIEAIRDLLYWLGGIIIGIGLILDDILIMYSVRPLWFIAFNVIYFSGDFLYFWYLKNYWDIKREGVPPIEPPVIM